jgi:hypothetical protein
MKKKIKRNQVRGVAKSESMTADQIIYATALNNGIPSPLALLMVAQSKHETGDYTSHAFTQFNNAFGYAYVPGAQLQTGPGLTADNGQPVAAYANVSDSALEMVNWIYRRQDEGKFPADLSTITDADTYAGLLKQCGYYGDSFTNYSAGIARWFTDNIALASSTGILLLAGGALFLYLYGKGHI